MHKLAVKASMVSFWYRYITRRDSGGLHDGRKRDKDDEACPMTTNTSRTAMAFSRG